MLTFAIPTWNRAPKLQICLDSICLQINNKPGYRVVVCDNGSSDNTRDLLANYKKKHDFVFFESLPEMKDGASCVNSVNMVETEWTWTFGDDDVLRPGALEKVVSVLENNPHLHFIHAAQTSRTGKSRKLHTANKFVELCESYGWLDTCGFISSNICRTIDIKKAYENYLFFNDEIGTIFPHSACLLERLHDKPAALLDDDLVGLQDDVQTEDTIKRWKLANAVTRYFYVGDSLVNIMGKVPALKKSYPATFFRYHTYHLWDRLLRDVANEFRITKRPIPADVFEKITLLSSLVQESEVRKRILTNITFQTLAMENITKGYQTLENVISNSEIPTFGFKNIVVLPPHINEILVLPISDPVRETIAENPA